MHRHHLWEGLKAALPPALADALDDPRIRVAINGALLKLGLIAHSF